MVSNFTSSGSTVRAELDENRFIPNYVFNADPIQIASDAELDDYDGSGTFEDPYRIEDLVINSIDFDGIYIHDTSYYFIIRNCTIVTPNSYGIDIYNVETGTANVWNCTIIAGISGIRVRNSNYPNIHNNTVDSASTAGIELSSCYSPDIIDNTVFNCFMGISLVSCYYSYIFLNDIFDNSDDGIHIVSSNYATIDANTCDNNIVGISVQSSFNSQILNNFCTTNDGYGVLAEYSDYSSIIGNNFSECGIGIFDVFESDLLTLTLESNYIDSTLIYYGENITETSILTQYSQFILVNCSDVLISSQNQMANSLFIAVAIYYCDNIEFENCFVSDANYGLYFYSSDELRIYNNTLQNNVIGLNGYNSIGGLIRQNIINNGFQGIILQFAVNNNTIFENTIQTMTGYAISLLSSDNNTVYHNNLIDIGSGSSFCYDTGTGNYWYNITLSEGNYYSNWVSGPYSIDGSSGSVDLFPLGSPYIPTPVVSEYVLLSWFSVIFLAIIPCMGIYLKKRK
ncbi:MAG: right-handed parallel beta-helix repeat-containing protein [Candidatus Heimdallarchaeaceae archaeon]